MRNRLFKKVLLTVCIIATTATAQLGTSIEVVFVEAGSYVMGDTRGVPLWGVWWSPATENVTIANDFWIGKYPITQAQYQAVMGNNPSHFSGRPNNPVESVNWNEAVAFATAVGGRLPTQEEWEWAARGGNRSNNYLYSGSDNIGDVAWYRQNSSNSTQPVGTKAPNELGIYDMSGNVYEWTATEGLFGSSSRVIRGGSWGLDAEYCRVVHRGDGSWPDHWCYFLGFRVAFNSSNIELKKVSFEKNNGSAMYVVGVVGDATTITRPADPTKEGCVFAGWYKNAKLTEKWDFATDKVSSDTTLYAKWEYIPLGTSIEVVLVKAGSYVMGDTRGVPVSWRNHATENVTIAEDFWIGKYPITQAQFQAVIGHNPSLFNGRPNNPVEGVSWHHAVAFATAVSGRLPTQEEWEWAARGGNLTKNYLYSGSDNIDEVAWYRDNRPTDSTQPVGQKKPNELGIYDMSGNVSEWTATKLATTILTDCVFNSAHIARGGSWLFIAEWNRVIYRLGSCSDETHISLGFRVAFSSSFAGVKKIRYEKNNGSAVYVVGVVGDPTTITPPPVPTKEGYVFAGWYKNAELTEQWDFATDRVSRDTTLYAKWDGGSASIFRSKKQDSRHGIRFANSIVSENAEISVVLPNNERAANTNVVVYDITGNTVFSTTTTRDNVSWDLRNTAGRIVANGTYLVIAEVKDRSGRVYTYSARLGVKR